MFDTLKEHFQEFAADTMLRHVLPSILMAHAALLAHKLNFPNGKPLLSEKSVQALTALTILGVNYAIHLWFYLKRMAAANKAKA